eukprot:8983851-Pyramimonas_sp.AAC.1
MSSEPEPCGSLSMRTFWNPVVSAFKAILTIDTESVFKSLSSKDSKKPSERALLRQISCLTQSGPRCSSWRAVVRCARCDLWRPCQGVHRSCVTAARDGRQSVLEVRSKEEHALSRQEGHRQRRGALFRAGGCQ